MKRVNEETDAINLFESRICGIIFHEDKTTLTILIDWKDGSGDTQLERISFIVRYCSKFQCSIRQNEYFKLPLCDGFEITGFSYKKVELGYIVQFNFDLSTEGYLRFYCYEFSIETVGEPLQSGGNDNLIEDF